MSVSEPIRVLHVIGAMDRGGAETLVMNLYRHMDRSQIQFDFLVNEERRCDYDAEIMGLGGQIFRIPRLALVNYLTYRKACRDFFRNDSHPIVHGHIGFPAAIYLDCAKKLSGAFTIAHSHAQNFPLSPTQLLYSAVAHRVRGKADFYLACSEQAGLNRFGKRIVSGNHFSVLKNGIDTQALCFDFTARKRVRDELGIPSTAPVFGHVGRLTPIKNHPHLLETFRNIKSELPGSWLVLVGRGESEREIKHLVNKLGLNDSVIFAGVRDDVPAFLSAFDVFIFPSFREGLPVSVIEAQASGLPCLLSTGLPELAKISATTEFAELSEGPVVWARRAAELYRSSRSDRTIAIQDAISSGFDIQESADWLTELYLRSIC